MPAVRGAQRLCVRALVVGLLSLLIPPVLETAHAQTKAQWSVERVFPYTDVRSNWWDCGLRKIEADAFVSQRPDRRKQRKASATILADYGKNFPVEAQAAFERAIEIWEAHISTPVTIRIDARFGELDTGVLAGAGPTLLVVDTTGDEEGDIIYGSPLLDARTGTDQLPREPDMHVQFGDRDDWHYKRTPAPAGKIDFTTVALHEIGHGLNYVDLFRAGGIPGSYGIDFNKNGRIDTGERFIGVYGQRLTQKQEDGSLLALTDEQAFGNPSRALGDALRSGRLFFNGDKSNQEARESNGPALPKIYSPSQFDRGSSISHLDEDVYPPETRNALMTPLLSRAETIRLPGPIMCAQLIDMGWPPGPGCALDDLALFASRGRVEGTQVNQQRRVRLSWELRGQVSPETAVREFVVEQQRFVGSGSYTPFVRRTTVSAKGPGEYSVLLDDVRVGTHTFRITPDNGTIPPVTTTVSVEADQPDVSVSPNPFEETARISFVLPRAQTVKVEVFDVLGRHVATPFHGRRPADTARPVSFDASRLSNPASGIYFFQVTGETFTQTEKAMLVE